MLHALYSTLAHVASIAGFALAIVLLARVLKERRPTGTTLAWLLAIALVPHVGVPAYLIFGGRKRSARPKPLPPTTPRLENATERVLCAAGEPPAAPGHALTVYPTSVTAFDAALDAVVTARRSVRIATFILGSDDCGDAMLDALIAAAQRGVAVHVLLDGLFAARADGARLAALRRAGGAHAVFTPLVHRPWRGRTTLRLHRKLLLVDGSKALLGGMNLAHEYMGPCDDPLRWRDVLAEVTGPAVAQLDAIFRGDWAFATREALPAAEAHDDGVAGARADAGFAQVVASGPDRATDTFYDALLTAVFEARSRIWIVTPYFVPDAALLRALELAVRRGVEVRIVVPAQSNHVASDLAGASALRQLAQIGAVVHPYRGGMLHAKLYVIDEKLGAIGSANCNMRSLFLDYEVMLIVYSRAEVLKLAAWVEALSPECTGELRPAGMFRSLAEDVGLLVAPLV